MPLPVTDYLIGLFYFIVIFFTSLYAINRAYPDDKSTRRTFLLALIFKLGACVAFIYLHVFYYGYGDSIAYLQAGETMAKYVSDHPKSLLDFIFIDQQTLKTNYSDFFSYTTSVRDYFIDGNLMVHRFVLVLGFLTFYSYTATSVIFSLLSFIGCWKIFKVLSRLYPEFKTQIKISFLFLPSVVFWTAGIGKDALCLLFINLSAAFIIRAFIYHERKLVFVIASALFLYITLVIKSYIVLSFLPIFIYFILSEKIGQIKQIPKKILLRFSVIVIILGCLIAIYLNGVIVEKITDEIVSSALYLAEHQLLADMGNGSKYDLGFTMDDFANKNVLPYIMPSIEVALFRPYAWEIKNVIMIFSFIESFMFFILTIYVLLKGYIKNVLILIYKNPFLQFCIIYTLIFSFFVGLASANFGTLIRYKTPFISYFLLSLLMIHHLLNKKKNPKNI